MASRQEMLAEAYRRGLLPPDKKSLYEEATKRGLINHSTNIDSGPMLPGESTSVLTGDKIGQADILRENEGLKSSKELISNIPGSAAQFGKDIFTAVRHPIETAKAVGKTAVGGVQKLIPGEQDLEPYADAFGQMVMDRYGSVENFKSTLIKDPVGALSDFAAVAMGVGAAIKGAGTAAKIPAITKVGKAMQSAGVTAEPINIIKQGVVKPLVKSIPTGAPKKMYESAAKLSTAIPEENRAAMTKTALDSGIMPTTKGVDKARRMINTLNDKITQTIDAATKKGSSIDTDALFRYLDDIKKETYLSDDPISNLRAVERVEKSIKAGIKAAGARQMTPAQAQKLKQRIYSAVNYENKPRATKYLDTTKKAIARAAKEEIEALHPEIKALNAKEGDLIKLLDAIQKSANRISNRDIIGIGVPIKGTMGGVVGGAPGAAAGLVGGILDTPQVKARIAIILNKARKAEMKNKPISTGVRLGAQQAGRLNSE